MVQWVPASIPKSYLSMFLRPSSGPIGQALQLFTVDCFQSTCRSSYALFALDAELARKRMSNRIENCAREVVNMMVQHFENQKT